MINPIDVQGNDDDRILQSIPYRIVFLRRQLVLNQSGNAPRFMETSQGLALCS